MPTKATVSVALSGIAQTLRSLPLRLMTTLIMLSLTAASPNITNPRVLIDMAQNNPGDPVAWQQTKYADPRQLARLNFTGQTPAR